MLRETQALTPELQAAVLLQLKQFRDETKMSLEEIGRSIDQSGPVLSEVIRGVYSGNTEKVIRKLDAWLTDEAPNKLAAVDRKMSRGSKFVMTLVAEEIFDYATAARRKGIMVYFAAPAGVGKTMALQAVAQRTLGAIYVCCRTKIDSSQAFFRQIWDAMGEPPVRGSYQTLYQRLVRKLQDTNRLLLIDQAHKLIDRRKDEALLSLGDLHDETECPMLLVGTQSVLTYLRDAENIARDPIEQLDSRIKLRRNITQRFLNSMGNKPGGKPVFTVKSIIEMMDRREIRLGPGAAELLTKIGNTQRGHLRIVDAVLDAIGLMYGDKRCEIVGAVTVKQIQDVLPQVLGRITPELDMPSEDEQPMQAVG